MKEEDSKDKDMKKKDLKEKALKDKDPEDKNSKKSKPILDEKDSKKGKPVLDEKDPKKRKPILNWKCIEDFDKVSDDKIFYNRKNIRLTEQQRIVAKKEFDKIRDKYRPILRDFVEQANGREKTHLIIAGGNYTFFFKLPKIIEWCEKKYPGMGIELRLFEHGGSTRLENQYADIILTSDSENFRFTDAEIEKAGYIKLKYSVKDRLFFAATKQLIAELGGSKEYVLQNADVISARRYFAQGLDKDVANRYALTIPGREHEQPRVTVDQYVMEYKMIHESVGIGTLYTSMKLSDDIVNLKDGPEFERFVLVKKDLDKKYWPIARRLINTLRYKE